MAKMNRPYHVAPSHYAHDTAFLKAATATSDDSCRVCHLTVVSGATFYYVDQPLHGGKTSVICGACVHQFQPNGSYMKPYWITQPGMAACNNIRTSDDKGWREFVDGIMDEWDDEWLGDLTLEDN